MKASKNRPASRLTLAYVITLAACCPVEAAWYKGQLHMHMQGGGDDGRFETVEQVGRAYRDAGYHFIAVTGHNVRHDTQALNTPGFVVLNGVELHNYAGAWLTDNPGWTHVNAINCRGVGPVDTSGAKTLQGLIDLAIRLGGIAQINHPAWQGYGANAGNGVLTVERLLRTRNATLLEVRGPDDEVKWDAFLSTGRQIFATKTDDNHGTQAGCNMVVVQAQSLSPASVVAALRAGEFYAANTHGIALRSITRRGRALTLEAGGCETAPVRMVEFVGKGGRLLHTVKAGVASYTLPADGLYVRARILAEDGGLALTQAWFPPAD